MVNVVKYGDDYRNQEAWRTKEVIMIFAKS
jgi:hypothetical protein